MPSWVSDGFVSVLFGELPEDERARKERQVNHMLALGYLPGRKAGRLWIGSKSQLHQHLIGK